MINPLKMFYCYAREDRALRDEIDIHLSGLKRQNLIVSWHDYEISPGVEWEKEVGYQLNNADLILILVSPSFIYSDYLYSNEIKHAIERHTTGIAHIIPIILCPADWKDTPLGALQVLPTNGIPITQWSDRDEAFYEVAKGIRTAVRELRKKQSKEKIKRLFKEARYEEALIICQQGLALDPRDADFYDFQGYAFSVLGQYENALEAYKAATIIEPHNAQLHRSLESVLVSLQQYEEALAASDEAIRLNSSNPYFHKERGDILFALQRFQEALAAYENAIQLNPGFSLAYLGKSRALEQQARVLLQQATSYYERAKQLDEK